MNKKSKIITGFIIGIILVGLGIGGYYIYQNMELKKPIKEKWGQKYYVYLKDIKKDKKQEDAAFQMI